MATVIEVRDLWTQLGAQVIHRELTLDVMRGETLALVGGSGSGKTTLLRALMGLLRPMRGVIRILGEELKNQDMTQQRRMRRRWGVLFQQGALFSALNVFDNIAFPLRELRNLDSRSIRDLVMIKLHLVGLDPADTSKFPAQLSGGMTKRVALARALALDAELLFLDEPTSGLDPIAANAFDQLICTLRDELNLTVLMITHDLDSIATICDRVAVLAEGRFITVAPLPEVAALDHPFIREFFHGARGDRILATRQARQA